MTNKTVSLVLGSGGARGLAHVGIIHWLEENGYDIRSISGCSMGALFFCVTNAVLWKMEFGHNPLDEARVNKKRSKLKDPSVQKGVSQHLQ